MHFAELLISVGYYYQCSLKNYPPKEVTNNTAKNKKQKKKNYNKFLNYKNHYMPSDLNKEPV